MKTKLTILSALSLVALMACQREKVDNNPTYDPERNTVTTKLVLNVSTTNGAPKTKQTALDVQADGNFRGMTDVHVLAYTLGYSGVGGANYLFRVADESSKATRDYDLGNMVTEITSENSTRILELSLPLATNSILLYGKATKTGTDDAQGAVIPSGTALNSTLENVSFKLKNRLADTAAFRQYGDLMGRILTGIMNSGLVMETTQSGYKEDKDNTYDFWYNEDTNTGAPGLDPDHPIDTAGWAANPPTGYSRHRGSQTWRQYGLKYKNNLDPDKQHQDMSPLEEVLGEAYFEIMNLKGVEPKVELRTASSASILRMTSDLHNILLRVLNASPTSWQEYLCQLVATEILSRARYFYALNSAGEVVWQPVATIMAGVNTLIPNRQSTDYNLVTDDFFYNATSGNMGFPLNLGMPMGAAIMKFITVGPKNIPDNQYDVVTILDSIPAYGMGNAPALSIKNYRYPAELMYYTNSSLRVSDKPVEVNTYPLIPSDWNRDNYWGNIWTSNGSVKSTTRAVAVTKPINYGTALMKSVVGYAESQIEDNNHGIHPSETNNAIDVSSGNKFEVTGVMIGGVCDDVGYDFLPQGSFDKMIYDKLGDKSFYIPVWQTGNARFSSPVYTLTWDNYNKALLDGEGGQAKVYVALEVVNRTGTDIWGELNLIRNGGTFYLVGELDPNKAGVAENLPKDAQGKIDLTRPDFFYPPYDPTTGATLNVPRVFMQDYVTSVKFNFTKTSLQHAYITMPDLRSGQVSLGLSVDIEWEDGMEFDVNLGEVTGN